MLSTYLGLRLYTKDLPRSLARTAAEPIVARDAKYYQATIGTVKSVDAFVGNYRLFSYAMRAAGLEDMTYAKAFMKKVLQSELADKTSFANKLTDSRYREFAAAYNFAKDGGLTDQAVLQAADQQADTLGLYAAQVALDPGLDKNESTYFQIASGKATSVAGLLADARVTNYLVAAYGLDPATPGTTLVQAMESDLSDPTSFANASGDAKLVALAGDFNVAADGSIARRRLVQSPADMKATTTAYAAAGGTAAPAAALQAETDYYLATIPKVASLDGLLHDRRLVAYVAKAYGFGAAIPSDTTLRRVLTSVVADKVSFANTAHDSRYVALAKAFDFSAKGTVLRDPARIAQDREDALATSDAYVRQTMETEAGADNEGVRLALYFQRKAPSVKSPFDLLADKALLQVVQTALSIPAATSQADVDAQARMITAKLTIADLRNPAKLQSFLARFATLYDLANGGGASSPALAILAGGRA